MNNGNNLFKYKCANCGAKLAVLFKYNLCKKCYRYLGGKKSSKNGHIVKHNPKTCACIDCDEPTKSTKHKFCEEHSSQSKNSQRAQLYNKGKIYE